MIWLRVAAGAVPGFFLAAALAACIDRLLWPDWRQGIVIALLAFIVLWMLIAGCSLFFRRARSAWLWLTGAALTLLVVLEFVVPMATTA